MLLLGALNGSDGTLAHAFELGAAGIVALAVLYFAWIADPAWLLSLGIALDVFSGHFNSLGLPLPVDRVLIGLGSIVLLFRLRAARDRPTLPARGVHFMIAAAALYAIGSAFWVGTLSDHDARFALIDRFGLLPFWMFFIAPVAFRTERQRQILLGTLVVLGGYLGLTAFFEGVKATSLVLPHYITDPTIGIHGGRARGPFVEAAANGFGLTACATAAWMASVTWRSRRLRVVALAIMALCLLGVLFTLTRTVWLGAVVGVLVVLGVFPELRRFFVPVVAIGWVAITVAIFTVPGLSSEVSTRFHDQQSIYVRQSTNGAAMRLLDTDPLFGIGWNTYRAKSPDYFRQAADRPIKGVGEPVHNIIISNATELGLVGVTLWAFALLWGVGGAALRECPLELRVWRIGLVAIGLDWLVITNGMPLLQPFPHMLLWTWAGIVLGPRILGEWPRASGRAAEAVLYAPPAAVRDPWQPRYRTVSSRVAWGVLYLVAVLLAGATILLTLLTLTGVLR